MGEITRELKATARRLGFSLSGVCPAATPEGVSRLAEWLAAGYAGQMRYLAERQEAYAHPRHVLAGARSLLVLGMNYATVRPEDPQPGYGRVARYALGRDYHDVVHDRLAALAECLRRYSPGAAVRGVVDTAPLLEREFAQLAGLGWVGKNTLLINRQAGSWFFLAALLTDIELAYDEPERADHCGTCTACLDACPTGAFVAPYVLDSRRCISYLTIELREPVPHELRPGIGDWFYGCDVCQEVCPWNRRAPRTEVDELKPLVAAEGINLTKLFWLDDNQFRARFRHTPLWRAKRRGLLRNAAIVLGNRPDPAAIPALLRGLADQEPLVRGAAAWALKQYREPEAREALCAQRERETDPTVLAEIVATP